MPVYKYIDENGAIAYSDRPPSGDHPELGDVDLHNAVGTVVTNVQAARDRAAAAAAAEDERLEADERSAAQKRQDVGAAKSSCDAQLAEGHAQRIEASETWAANTRGFADNANRAAQAASQGLNDALQTNNAARIGQNVVSQGAAVGGRFVPGWGSVGATAISGLTSVPAVVTAAPTGGLTQNQQAVQGVFNATTSNLASGAENLSRVGRAGRSVLGANSLVGDLKSAAGLIQGPGLYDLIGSTSTAELVAFREALEGGDLAFAEEWFGYDAEELQGKIDEVLDTRDRAEVQEARAEHAEEQIAATARLNDQLTGACVFEAAAPAREEHRDRLSENAAQHRAALVDANAAFEDADAAGNALFDAPKP